MNNNLRLAAGFVFIVPAVVGVIYPIVFMLAAIITAAIFYPHFDAQMLMGLLALIAIGIPIGLIASYSLLIPTAALSAILARLTFKKSTTVRSRDALVLGVLAAVFALFSIPLIVCLFEHPTDRQFFEDLMFPYSWKLTQPRGADDVYEPYFHLAALGISVPLAVLAATRAAGWRRSTQSS